MESELGTKGEEFDRLEDVPSAKDLALIARYADENGKYAEEIEEEAEERYLVTNEWSDIYKAADIASDLSDDYKDFKEEIGTEYTIRNPNYTVAGQVPMTIDSDMIEVAKDSIYRNLSTIKEFLSKSREERKLGLREVHPKELIDEPVVPKREEPEN
ncbi:MAG: hypothetical protein ABEJ72_07150 [Candidatus Aenigmatarchaeota archaeon]